MDKKAVELLKSQYTMSLKHYKLLREKGERLVWYVETNKGNFCLKKYNRPLETYLFSIQCQEHLIKKGVRLPKLVRTKNNLPYSLDDKGTLYVLFQWLPNESLDLGNVKNVKRTLKGLARFHKEGKGFIPSMPSLASSRYLLTTKNEEQMIKEMIQSSTKIHSISPSVRKILKAYHPQLTDRTEVAVEKIKKLMVSGDLHEEAKKRYVAHNDMAEINLLLNKKRIYLIDFDDLSYNFPTVDIEQLFVKVARKGCIKSEQIPLWISSYCNAFTLSAPLRQLLIQRLSLPTLYLSAVKNLDRRKSDSVDKWKAQIRWEKEKYKELSRL